MRVLFICMAVPVSKQSLSLGLGAVGVQPTPMEVSGPNQAVQMDLKALLEAHTIERPLESAYHG